MKTNNPEAVRRTGRRLTRGAAVTLAALGLTAIAAVVSTQVIGAGAPTADAQISPDRITFNHNQVLV